MNYKLLPLLLLVACDSGDITERDYEVRSEGKCVKLTATARGLDDWSDDSHLALACFAQGNQYAVTQRILSTADGNTPISLTLTHIDSSTSTVELAITNKLRKRLLTLVSLNLEDYAESDDTIRLDLGHIDLSMLGCLQRGVFDRACVQCHGANGRKAAGLDLTEGHSYANLVNAPSTTKEGTTRVVAGNAEASLLHQILSEDGHDILHYNHTEVLSSQFKDNLEETRRLIDKWMENCGL